MGIFGHSSSARGATMMGVPFASYPLPPTDPVVIAASKQLDPLLEPMGFLAGQAGSGDGRAQIIYCRGFDASPDDGCIDLVIDLELADKWHVTDVRYWGFPSERWHLSFDRNADLAEQLAGLERTLSDQLRD